MTEVKSQKRATDGRGGLQYVTPMGICYMMFHAGKVKVPKEYTFPSVLNEKTGDWRLPWFVLMELGVVTIFSSGEPIKFSSPSDEKLVCRLYSVFQQHQQRFVRVIFETCRWQDGGRVEKSRAKGNRPITFPLRLLRYSKIAHHRFQPIPSAPVDWSRECYIQGSDTQKRRSPGIAGSEDVHLHNHSIWNAVT